MEFNSEEIATKIREIANQSKTEEDFKIRVSSLFDKITQELGLQSAVEYEKVIYKARRADAVYPAIIFEYKKPGRLGSKSVQTEAIEELGDYLKGLARSETVPRKYVGVAIDGHHILFIRAKPSAAKLQKKQITLLGEVLEESPNWEIQGPFEINGASIGQLFLFFRGLSRKTLSPDYLAVDFGSKSDVGKKAIKVLYEKLARTQSPKTIVLFDEWKRLFGIIYGEDLAKAKKDLKRVVDDYELEDPVNLQEFLFTIHTYFAFLMKLIAAEILSLREGALISSLAKEISTLNDEELQTKLVDLEEGGLFKRLGITNYMEGDFFSWYLSEWTAEVAQVSRSIAQNLSMYEPATTSLEPDEARDLLKKLYQYLVPKSIRHDLGEYYTPDWLAELVIDEIRYDGTPTKRVLDPACGSGTFLVLAIKRILQRLRDYPEKYDRKQVMKMILANIVGFDVNPIAVLAARTNFLIAVSDLRKSAGITEIEIPIYLADSVLTPRKNMAPTGENEFTLLTKAGLFTIPAALAKKEYLEFSLNVLDETIEVKADYKTFIEKLAKKIPPPILEESERGLKQLFNKLLKLETEKKNRIWSRIIKNNFAPVYIEKFDYIIGNPPWINWQNLSTEYREATSDLWWLYGLFQHRGFSARLGGSKVDFSMLFTYAAIDNYLKEDGQLGFVITQTVFKTKGVGGEHFRRFKIGMDDNTATFLSVQAVHDLVEVKPFKGIASRAAIIMLKKGTKSTYPMKYFVWRKKTKGSLSPDLKYRKALRLLCMKEKRAVPIDSKNELSPWLTAAEDAIEPLRKTLGESPYEAHEGVNTLGANGVYWIEVIQTREDGCLIVKNLPKTGDANLKQIEAVIEPDFVYPLLTGREISTWKVRLSKHILMMHDPKARKGYDENQVKVNYPKTYAYLKKFESFLLNRPIYKKFFCEKKKKVKGKEIFVPKAPFYTMYGVGDYTFAPFKAIWKEQSSMLTCALLDIEKVGKVIPDHKVMFAPFWEKEPAYFCCALLSSTPCRAVTKAYVIGTSTSTHILEYVKIPKFDPKDPIHKELIALAQEAYQSSEKDDEVRLQLIEDKIDRCACKIWQITEGELGIIKNELQ